jgi:hypothetical protein
VAEDQELAVADDVTQHFACVDLGRHRPLSWPADRLVPAWKIGGVAMPVVRDQARSCSRPE